MELNMVAMCIICGSLLVRTLGDISHSDGQKGEGERRRNLEDL